MTHWNYRIVKTVEVIAGEEYTSYGIHECVYDLDGETGWTEEPVQVISDTPEGIKWVLEKMKQALKRPVIEDSC